MPRIPTGVAAAILLAAHVSAPLVSARAEQSTATAGSESHGLGLQLLADELTAPIDLVSPPDSSGRRFVTD